MRFQYLYISLFLSICLSFSCEKKQEIATTIDPNLEEEVLMIINNYRTTKSLITLNSNFRLKELAREHSQNMATGKSDVGHDGFYTRANIIFNELGSGSVAENVASGQRTAQQVVDQWLESPEHKDNIEGDYELTGIGIVSDDKNKYYFTHIFFKPNN